MMILCCLSPTCGLTDPGTRVVRIRFPFLSTRPPEFSHALEPLDADDWLKVVESKLLISQCSDREKVLYATHQLTSSAADWWTTYVAAHDHPENINWDEFKNAFHRHFVPEGEIKLKR